MDIPRACYSNLPSGESATYRATWRTARIFVDNKRNIALQYFYVLATRYETHSAYAEFQVYAGCSNSVAGILYLRQWRNIIMSTVVT